LWLTCSSAAPHHPALCSNSHPPNSQKRPPLPVMIDVVQRVEASKCCLRFWPSGIGSGRVEIGSAMQPLNGAACVEKRRETKYRLRALELPSTSPFFGGSPSCVDDTKTIFRRRFNTNIQRAGSGVHITYRRSPNLVITHISFCSI